MKKLILTIMLVSTLFSQGNDRSGTYISTWYGGLLMGTAGTAITTPQWIQDGRGNLSPFALDFSNGRVGIGTLSPSFALDVSGKINSDNFKTEGISQHSVAVGDSAGFDSTYTVFVGASAGKNNASIKSVGVGYHSLKDNSGERGTGIGYQSLASNSGEFVTGGGFLAARSNTGNYVAGFGVYSAQSNRGNFSSGNGAYSIEYNIGHNSTGSGYFSLNHNTKDNVSGFGAYSLRYNDGTQNSALGMNAFNLFTEDAGNAVDASVVVFAESRIVSVAHGFTGYVNLKASTTGVLPTGLTTDVNQWQATHVDTLYCRTDTFSDAGTGTLTLTPQTIYTNSTAIGYNAEPDENNQVMLGDANVTEVKTTGSFISNGKYAILGGTSENTQKVLRFSITGVTDATQVTLRTLENWNGEALASETVDSDTPTGGTRFDISADGETATIKGLSQTVVGVWIGGIVYNDVGTVYNVLLPAVAGGDITVGLRDATTGVAIDLTSIANAKFVQLILMYVTSS